MVILSGQQDFVFKLVTVQSAGHLLLRSLNPVFEPYTVPVSEVAEIWKFHAYTSKEIPEPETDLQQLVRAVREMQLEMKGSKG